MFNPLPTDLTALLAERHLLQNFIGQAAYLDTAILGRLVEIARALHAAS